MNLTHNWLQCSKMIDNQQVLKLTWWEDNQRHCIDDIWFHRAVFECCSSRPSTFYNPNSLRHHKVLSSSWGCQRSSFSAKHFRLIKKSISMNVKLHFDCQQTIVEQRDAIVRISQVNEAIFWLWWGAIVAGAFLTFASIRGENFVVADVSFAFLASRTNTSCWFQSAATSRIPTGIRFVIFWF